MRRGVKGNRTQRGLTLLELVVAVAVLSIGTLAAIRAVDQSRVGIGDAMPRILAQHAARNRAEELRFLGAEAGALPASVAMGGHDFTLEVARQGTAAGLVRMDITARSAVGPGAVVVTVLPPPGVLR